jgi:hypothetical protein
VSLSRSIVSVGEEPKGEIFISRVLYQLNSMNFFKIDFNHTLFVVLEHALARFVEDEVMTDLQNHSASEIKLVADLVAIFANTCFKDLLSILEDVKNRLARDL